MSYLFGKIKNKTAPASVAQLAGCAPVHQNVAGWLWSLGFSPR